ncbi:hypothetical protein PZB74_11585 [Porifericola rhodea]|uniref:ATP-grasp domain-containing protein n=1 Tax=Porifericola rhodea TaxID=930972 RepID=UPI0026663573|nr:hypothetical protein [Porifericola rhodea]WKN29606.1 hypothetical protein PZB74_11585 [Porifericola rhodea]
MRSCAFLSMDSLDGFYSYDRLAFEPLRELGWKTEEVSWRKQNVNWNQYDAVVIRTTWDYQSAPEAFMQVLEDIEKSSAQLENSLDLVRWNLSKTYLKQLEEKGIAIVPTLWGEPTSTDTSISFDLAQLQKWKIDLATKELIVKPVISANADHTYRIAASLPEQELHEIGKAFEQRAFMVQPFLESIVAEGEYSLFFFGGNYSHTVLKRPKAQDFRVQEEHGGRISAITPEQEVLNTAYQVMEAIQPQPLYARVDLVRDKEGRFVLMEVELIEPSLYFEYSTASPSLFAQALNNSIR